MDMNETEQKLTIEGLAKSVGISVRTVRFYITQGLIPGPRARGKSATYDEEHLLRLRLVRRLSEQRVPLAEIRERVSGLSLAAIRSLLQEEDRRDAELRRADKNLSPKEYISDLLNRARATRRLAVFTESAFDLNISAIPRAALHAQAHETLPPSQPTETWYRWELATGVELHVKSSENARHADLIERLLRLAEKNRGGTNE